MKTLLLLLLLALPVRAVPPIFSVSIIYGLNDDGTLVD
jgi:hypothetical protein